jgi:hypothetical protein
MIEKLKEKGMYENTIIVYTSDHGSHFRTRDGEYKRNCTDGCLHIPMIVRGPGFKGGLFVDSMVSLLDIVPTIMKAADIPVPKHVRGNPLQKLVEGALDGWPDCIFAQVSETQVGRVIRTKDWKFSVRAPGLKGPDYSKSRVYMEDFLFDLQKDPHELHNLVDDPSTKEIRENLGKRLIEWISEVEGYIPMIIQHMETPEPQIFAERGTLLLDSENILSMRIGEGSKKALAMDIPLYELLEDVIGEPMIVDTNGKKSIGRFIMDEKDDQCLLFESLDEKSPSIMNVKEIFKEILRNYVNFSILLPSIEEKVRYKTTNLKYYILIHKE